MSALAWCEKEVNSATGMENILRLFVKSQKQLKLNNSGVHSSFDRSELYLSTENQSWKCCWKQEEDGSGQALLSLLSLLGCFL